MGRTLRREVKSSTVEGESRVCFTVGRQRVKRDLHIIVPAASARKFFGAYLFLIDCKRGTSCRHLKTNRFYVLRYPVPHGPYRIYHAETTDCPSQTITLDRT